MSKSNYLKNAILNLVLTNEIPAFLQDKSVFAALHIEDPLATGAGGKQNSFEVSYDGYSRVEISKSLESFVAKDSSASNNVDLSFPPCKSGGVVARYWSYGRQATGPGDILYSGKMSLELGIGAMSIPFAPKNEINITEG